MPRVRQVRILPAVMLALLPCPATAQERQGPREVEPYFRALGEHFRVSRGEVEVLAAWGLPPDHLPVVLLMSRRSTVSPDALISARRSGHSWAEVAERFGMDASTFHVLLARDASPGPLASAYRRFAAVPRARWSGIELTDAEIVGLANVRFIASVLGLAPGRVLEAAAGEASFVAVYRRLDAR